MSEADLETYSNAEAIRVNQDPLGEPAKLVFSNCPPYPKFHLGMAADGWPEFRMDFEGTIDAEASVDCGTHRANYCSACPQGECESDCWVEPPSGGSHGSTGKSRQCVRRGFDVWDPPLPFSRANYWTA